MSPRPEGTDCESVLDQLEAWIDDDLESAVAAVLEEHLASCPACRAEASMAREIRDELRELPRFDAPEVMLAKVRAAARSQDPAGQRGRWGGRRATPFWLAAAALLAAAIVVPGIIGPGSDEAALEMATLQPPQETYDAADIERATEEARFAIALVSNVSRRTGLEIRDDLILGRVIRPTAESLSKLKNMRRERVGETNET